MKNELQVPEQDSSDCRLCGRKALGLFTLTVLHTYEVRYYKCGNCLSVQTEPPYWLDEAYEKSLSNLDTGAAQRAIHNLSIAYFVSKLYGLRNAIDFGGGDGLLCRLLRDYGINCFVTDKYAAPTYAQGFTEPDFTQADVVTAFEVIEHFSAPKVDLHALFALQPKVLLISTGIYTDQSKDWWYFSPESGQHIFFYSKRALEWIAEENGYKVITAGGCAMFVRPDTVSPSRELLTVFMLKTRMLRLVRALLVLLPTPNSERDNMAQRAGGKCSRQ